MSEEKKEGQKTIVSFIVGLLIGGILVWAFSSPDASAPEVSNSNEEEKEMVSDNTDQSKSTDQNVETKTPEVRLFTGDGEIKIQNQNAGPSVELQSATYPISEGWIGVRDYNNDQLGGLLGVVRFSESQGLTPSSIVLQRNTKAGMEYAVVVYNDNGDQTFSLAEDSQLDSVLATFTAE